MSHCLKINKKSLIFLIFLSHFSHYSKSQIFVQKFNFDKKPNIFTSFHPNFFLTIFLVKSKLSTAKKSKTTTFSWVFHPKNRQFSREIKVEFLDKKWRFRTVCYRFMRSGSFCSVSSQTHFSWWFSSLDFQFFNTTNTTNFFGESSNWVFWLIQAQKRSLELKITETVPPNSKISARFS